MKAYYCIDANTLITAWNIHYPENVFSSLWKKLANHQDNIILIKPIFDQIDPILQQDRNKTEKEKADKYSLRMWMINNQFMPTPLGESTENRELELFSASQSLPHISEVDIERESFKLEMEYKIANNSKGVDEKDLKLIAYAKLNKKIIVTEERKQPEKPKKKCNYKIPLVCDEQGVKCINFVEMLRRLSIKI